MKTSPHEQPEFDPSLMLHPPKRRGLGCLFWLLALGGLAAGGYFYYFAPKQQGQESAAQVEYKTEEVRQGDLVVTVTATGTLQPIN